MMYFAIVVYRCYVASIYTGDIDIECLYFDRNSDEEVTSAIHERDNQVYSNSDGELVEWILDEIVTVEEVRELTSGEEVIGFICRENSFVKLES
jgi:penicillin V acylase-like amidase (Ntn superfamily)